MTSDAVFLDSVGLIAVWNADDQWHAAAKPVFADLVKEKTRLVTTTYILLECGNAAARRPFRNDVIAPAECVEFASGPDRTDARGRRRRLGGLRAR